MLQSLCKLQGLEVLADQSQAGTLEDILFDDIAWRIRYLAVHHAGRDGPRRLLLAPQAVCELDADACRLVTDLALEDLLAQPVFREELPPSRSLEAALVERYRWGAYWADNPMFFGQPNAPRDRPTQYRHWSEAQRQPPPELKSFSSLKGAQAQGTDAPAGEVVDCVFDTTDWRIRYLLIELEEGQSIVAPPDWIRKAAWQHKCIDLDLPRETLASSPVWQGQCP
jgi:hypothetical protein